MPEIQYSIHINAPASRVWDTVISPDTYRIWTKPFNVDSRFEGSWEQGSKIRFLGTDGDGRTVGMHAEIAENQPYERISIRHLGEIVDGDEKKGFSVGPDFGGGYETYEFSESNGVTAMTVTMDSPAEYIAMFDSMWPMALEALKNVVEVV